jgi:hypothetical protein
MLPSVERFERSAARAGLQCEDAYAFGRDYAETLRRWRTLTTHERAQVVAQGFDAHFMRIWDLYFAYCEAAFDEGRTDVVQFLLHKAKRRSWLAALTLAVLAASAAAGAPDWRVQCHRRRRWAVAT